jgi:hypothetical protein
VIKRLYSQINGYTSEAVKEIFETTGFDQMITVE